MKQRNLCITSVRNERVAEDRADIILVNQEIICELQVKVASSQSRLGKR